jgi:hypothetical protein
MSRSGTWKETGSGPDPWLIAAAAAVVVLCAGGTAGTFAAHLSAAITDLLYWIAGVIGTVAMAGAAALVWWLRGKPEREATAAAAIAERRRAREDEIEERRTRRAIVTAQAQAQAWAPLVSAITNAVQQPQPWPQPARVIRSEVER